MIAILAPYTRNEITAAAIRVADLALAKGLGVYFVGLDTTDKNVHPVWDKKVRRKLSVETVLRGTAKARTVVHFQLTKSLVTQASLIADVQERKQQQVLVCTEQMVASADSSLLYHFHKIVSTTIDARDRLRKVLDKSFSRRIVAPRWHAGITPTQRQGRVHPTLRKLCFYCDTATVDYCAPFMLSVVEHALECYADTLVTIVSTKRWCKQDFQALKQLSIKYGGRLLSRHIQCLDDFAVECHQHDWVALPSLRAYFGLPATIALACGTPVIANDMAPYTKLIGADAGVLIPCALYQGDHSSATAIPNLGRWLEAMDRVLRDDRILLKVLAADWKLDAIKTEFTETWEKIFSF